MTRITPRDRAFFEGRTRVTEEGCWEWKMFKRRSQRGGFYGATSDPVLGSGRAEGAHRVAYRNLVGPIPEGYEVDHLCVNSLCCNPDHLEAVTPAENKRRTHERGRAANQNTNKETCPTHGTAYDMESKRGDGRTFRSCRACYRDYQREYQRGVRARRKEKAS